MNRSNWLDPGLDRIWLPYTQMKTAPRPTPVGGTGSTHIITVDGRRLVDGVASWWTAVHGYNHPALIEAATRQLSAMPHIMLGGLAHEQAYRLATRLGALAPLEPGRVFFSESGSVAVEVALKIAVQYWLNSRGERRHRFLSFRGGYHGDTFATMAVCDPDEGMHSHFAGMLAEHPCLPVPQGEDDFAAIDALMGRDHTLAGVIIEPLIQGAGGMRMHGAATLAGLRALCDRHGLPLIFDEIFTGFGRTGALFAAQKAGIAPDIMTLGKALTGGVTPLAATLVSADIYAAFHDEEDDKALMHGPTYTGHAVGCAVANASLDLFEAEPRLDQVAALEAAMRAALEPLRAHPDVADVRVMGAVAALELAYDFDVEAARAWFIDAGVFIRPLGRVVYLTPAYCIDPAALAELTAAMARFLDRSG